MAVHRQVALEVTMGVVRGHHGPARQLGRHWTAGRLAGLADGGAAAKAPDQADE
ncbi:hypothetical protein OOK27_16265 [Streptomyces canus]|uniref:hypothetical protein n=1 Tax=Streptomyces canus TaxID=58343 RepID=UPI00224D4592|nr:hypothetical protein [Streptomyces canus]MCX5255674.1 hypothetical protein [Streptomyces canus]